MIPLSNPTRRVAGFTLMELLVVIAIILVLAAITLPVINVVNQHKNKAVALNNMHQLGVAAVSFCAEHEQIFPNEDSKGSDTWNAASNPENVDAWYNALPKRMGMKTVGDYAKAPHQFYTRENLLFLPGAKYPETDKKLVRPLFAIAINTKLQRKDESGHKSPLRLPNITADNSRVALFIEQGLPGEKDFSLATQPKYDGSPKGSAKSFVGRYSGLGVITFVDGHAELKEAKDLLTDTGRFPFPPEGVIWCRTVDEDPNK
jgi:prepilin-type N-terminal cleavage/methylation domain-containing protein